MHLEKVNKDLFVIPNKQMKKSSPECLVLFINFLASQDGIRSDTYPFLKSCLWPLKFLKYQILVLCIKASVFWYLSYSTMVVVHLVLGLCVFSFLGKTAYCKNRIYGEKKSPKFLNIFCSPLMSIIREPFVFI